MHKKLKLGFSLIELTATIAIAGILAAIGISGYMQTLMVSRRKEATIGLQRAMLKIDNTTPTQTAICPYNTNTNPPTTPAITNNNTDCLTANGLYYLNYDAGGFEYSETLPPDIMNNLINNEKVIFKATAVSNKSQSKDTDCLKIYLTDMNNLYPISPVNCVK